MTDTIKKTVGAQMGSQNRLGKFKDDAATSHLHLRCKPSEKAQWVQACQSQGGLSVCVINLLNKYLK